MISLYSGTPGSGKSLHIANRIFNNLKYQKNKIVIANFDCNLEKIKNLKGEFYYIDNSDLSVDKLISFSQEIEQRKNRELKENEILLVIDECQLLFNSREWGKKGRDKWLWFFSQHRKLGFEVVLIAQFDRMIDRQIRSLIEYEYIHRKVSNFGKQGIVMSLISGGGLFIAVKIWYPMKERVGKEFFKYSKKYASIYNTRAIFNA